MYVVQPWPISNEDLGQLREAVGSVDIAPGPGGSRITPCTAKVPVSLLPPLDLQVYTVSVVALYPTSQIAAHHDPPISGQRYHCPLVVNEGCWSFHDGTWQQLSVGRWYKMDPTQVHGAVNWGSTIRLHLIVDTEQ